MSFFTPFKVKKLSFFIPVKTGVLLSFFFFTFSVSQAQKVTEVITDFKGYWRSSSSTPNSVKPNTSHNVLAFKAGTETFSTGVNNSVLTQKGVAFTPGNFKSLPITSITGTVVARTSLFIALASLYDGVRDGYGTNLKVKMKDVLTDGINGLDIGTGVTNIPATATMTFVVESIDVNSINDSKPDILYTQIADPTTTGTLDIIYFTNTRGQMVGNSVAVDWSKIEHLGTYELDLYNLQPGETLDDAPISSGSSFNTTRNIRLNAFKLSDFGITRANAASVTSLIVRPGGQSDPAFMAYNTDAFVITMPEIIKQPVTQVVCTSGNQSATFSVKATGTNLTYQWKKNGVIIPGATDSTYTVSPVTPADAGSYEVLVTNDGGTVSSSVAYLNTLINRHPASVPLTATGNTVKLSVSALNADAYQWKKDGEDIPGATDSVFTFSPLNNSDGGSYTVKVINSASSGCATIESNPATVTPAIILYSKSTGNINEPATWGVNANGSGSTPVDFTRAEHTFVLSNRESGATLTNLTIAGTLDVKDGVAIISPNTILDVGRAIRTGIGSISGSSTAALTVRGNSNLFFTRGFQELKGFTVAGGTVNMLSPLTITGGDVPGKLNLIGGTLALGNSKITLRSSSIANTSMVTAVGSNAAITYGADGGFVVERFIPGKRSFRFLSPAVTTTTSIKKNWMEGVNNPDRWTNYNPLPGYGTHITGATNPADSVDATQTYNPSLYAFDNISQQWKVITNSSHTLTAGNPYRLMVRGSRAVDLNDNEATPSNTILRTTGKLTTGPVTVGLGKLNQQSGIYNFIGNPYASPINWNTLAKSNVSNTYYTWDQTLSRRGTYVAYNAAAGENSSPSSEVNEHIQSQQAFFIRSTDSNPTIQFSEANKSANNTLAFRGADQKTKLSLQLLISLEEGNSNIADATVAVFDDAFSASITDDDSYKFTNLDENIAIARQGTPLSIETRPMVKLNDTLPLKIWQYRQQDYWIKTNAFNFSPLLTAYLADNYLGTQTPINLDSSSLIPFKINSDSASFAPNRFSVIFESYSILPVKLSNINAFAKDKGVQVSWTATTETNIHNYEVEKSIDGQHFERAASVQPLPANAVGNHYTWFDPKPHNGNNFYRIKVIEKSAAAKYSSIARANISAAKSGFTISPNPIEDNRFGLQLFNLKSGRYLVYIYNSVGQRVFSSTIKHNGGSAFYQFSTQKLPTGNYSVQLSTAEARFTQSVFVK